jgi:hypothetical protein
MVMKTRYIGSSRMRIVMLRRKMNNNWTKARFEIMQQQQQQ